ncbi:proto-oncogene tyrosine-protein kinase receptor Ret-like, partial [Hetaerina americana]|uniref:proto-oncogene tyrosine-protein kinase receptor Ret-like n=1 Tax=Hetaerina americana TaxID=62018 RepID=UPI003A7F37C6
RDAARRLSPTYATCRPEASSCPNGACDELEEMSIGICPQDCTREVYGSARKQEGRGIRSATGVCSCDNFGKCSCGPVGTKAAAAPQHRQSTSEPPRGADADDKRRTVDQRASFDRYHDSCGENCFVALVLGVVAAFFIVLAGGFFARRRVVKRGGESGTHAARRLGVGSSRGPETAPAAAVAALAARGLEPEDAEASQSAQELPLLSVRPHSGLEGGDPRWELPRHALRLEGSLGEGEFGLVLKAKMRKTSHDGETTVAVKTLKEGAGEMERTALESEFKLLQSVNHINIVRLIGACTVPRNKSFLLVIEYAELGSLRNYLRKSRFNGAPLRRLPIAKPNAEETNSIWMDDDDGSSADSLTPRHIMSFAWQISKGMAYLSEMKLVHRDLAARNVLLSEKGICKISDFGLTRDVYEDEAYYKKSKGRVPVKWMAPESLSDHLYTTQSDVWSFGVLLWELITLGSSPYPGVPLTGLYSLLHSGYRMQKPPNCSSELYQMMMCCWQLHPRERPTFPNLMESLERMLQDEVEYLHLGPLLAVNPIYFSQAPADNSRSPTAAPPSDWEMERDSGEDELPVAGGPAAGAAGGRQPVAAGCGDCDWRELGDSEEEASDEKTSLQCYSQCYFMAENTQNEIDDGYEVPKLFQTRCSDSQDVVQLTSAHEDV